MSSSYEEMSLWISKHKTGRDDEDLASLDVELRKFCKRQEKVRSTTPPPPPPLPQTTTHAPTPLRRPRKGTSMDEVIQAFWKRASEQEEEYLAEEEYYKSLEATPVKSTLTGQSWSKLVSTSLTPQ